MSAPVAAVLVLPGTARLMVFDLLLDRAEEIPAEKQKKVCQREQHRRPGAPASHQQVDETQRTRKQGHILHLNGDDEEQQHLKIRVEHGKSKKQRQVDVVAGAVTCERSRQDGPEHAAQVIDVELEIAPGIFQCVADEIVEIKRQHKAQRAGALGNEHKGEQPPHLAVHHGGPVQRKTAEQQDVWVEQIGQIHHGLSRDDDQHQMGNADAAEFPFELIDPFHETFGSFLHRPRRGRILLFVESAAGGKNRRRYKDIVSKPLSVFNN